MRRKVRRKGRSQTGTKDEKQERTVKTRSWWSEGDTRGKGGWNTATDSPRARGCSPALSAALDARALLSSYLGKPVAK